MHKIENEWEQLPIAELHQFDALCDRFEHAVTHDINTRIEAFTGDLPLSQQRLIVHELLPHEIERRHASGETLTPDEFVSRFPQWAEEVKELATQCIQDLDRARIAGSDTVDRLADSDHTIDSRKEDLRAQWKAQWRVTSESIGHTGLPADGVLGHYRLKSVIGRGGMGIVVRAHDSKLTRDVAIKVLAGTTLHDTSAHDRFLREARAAAVIRHNHIVTIYSVDEIDRIPCLVMELVEGTTLDNYLREHGKLSPNEIACLACQMAEGLAAAHRQGLIHRDIKPANILLEKVTRDAGAGRSLSKWNVKITDFGLARIAADVKLTNSGLIAGTPQYMSPEQANGREIDTRSDLFSLGSVMYAMCAGQAAFHADSPLAILRQVADVPARSLQEVSPQTPVWLIDIIEKLMSKSPDDRFQSAEEVAELLSARVHELQFGDRTMVSKTAVNSPPRRLSLSLFDVTCFAVLLMIVAGVTFFIAQKNGTIKFEVNDPDIHISFSGKDVNITDGDQVYRFAAGEHELLVQHGDLSFKTSEFKLGKGEIVRLQVTYLNSRLAIERDGKQLWVGQEDTKSEHAESSNAKPAGYVWPENAPAPAVIPFTPQEAAVHQEAWARYLGVPIELENSIGMKLRLVPPGEFLMGSSPEEIETEQKIGQALNMLEWVFTFLPFESPKHHVTLTRPIAIGTYEVTRGQFRQFIDATGYKTSAEKDGKGGTGFKDSQFHEGVEFLWNSDLGFVPKETDEGPVVNVSWDDANEFCSWLSKKEGATYRLPYEAEWEFACRAGNAGRFCYGDDVAMLSDYAWLGDGKGVGARQVGQGLSNAFGLFDMHGNVWEFCDDWHGVYPGEPVIDPTGPATLHIPMKKVGRGGTWGSYRELCRSAYRSCGNTGAYSTGFRVTRTFPVSGEPQADADSK